MNKKAVLSYLPMHFAALTLIRLDYVVINQPKFLTRLDVCHEVLEALDRAELAGDFITIAQVDAQIREGAAFICYFLGLVVGIDGVARCRG